MVREIENGEGGGGGVKKKENLGGNFPFENCVTKIF